MLISMETSNRVSMSSTTFSLSQMQQLPAISRLRSSFLKKLPEPLRRAVADCLSSPLTSVLEPSRTLRVSSSFILIFSLCFYRAIHITCAQLHQRERDDNFSLNAIGYFNSFNVLIWSLSQFSILAFLL